MRELDGRTILVVEDEAIVAVMIADILQDLGATVVGPAGSLAQALALVNDPRVEAAFLDVNLRGEPADPVAMNLYDRGVPFAFATGYGTSPQGPWSDALVLPKPFNEATVLNAVRNMLGLNSPPSGGP
jgi:CheY-like chemotaxis protein